MPLFAVVWPVATKNVVRFDFVDFFAPAIALPVLSTLLGLFRSRALLHLEVLALRQ
jgi:hypothetical protein